MKRTEQLVIDVPREELAYIACALVQAYRYFEESQLIRYQVLPLEELEKIELDELVTSVGGITDPIGQLKSWLYDTLQSFFEWLSSAVQSTLTGLWKTFIKPAFDTVYSYFRDVLERNEHLRKLIEDVKKLVSSVIIEPIKDIINTIVTKFPNLGEIIETLIKRAREVIAELPKRLHEIISDVKAIVIDITDIGSRFLEKISKYLDWLPVRIDEIFKKIMSRVVEALDAIDKLITLSERGVKLLANIPDIVRKLVDLFERAPEIITRAVKKIEVFVWENLPDWAKKFLTEAPKALETIGVTFQGFVNAIMRLPDLFWSFVDIVKKRMEELKKWISENTAHLWTWLVTLATRILREVVDVLKEAYNTAVEISKGVATWIYTTFIEKPFAMLQVKAVEILRKLFEKALKGEIEGGELAPYIGITASMLPYATAVLAPSYIAEGIDETIRALEISGEPMGVGAKIRMRVLAILRKLSEMFKDLGHRLFEGLAIGMGINFFDPYRYLVRPLSKAFFDPIYAAAFGIESFFEVPGITQLRDILRRSMTKIDFEKLVKEGAVPKEFEEIYNIISRTLEVRGYPRWFIEYFLDLAKKYKMVVKDRFGNDRVIPFSPLFEVPTHSEIVRMLLRDVFASPMQWAQFVKIYGMSDHLAKMYYMLSFEYPSFSQLWEFMMRGISGMLWYVPPDFIKRWFEQDAKWLGAGVPIEPKKLNYDYNALFKAIPFYLKWIQKSNFSWFKRDTEIQYGEQKIRIDFDWTADSWLIWDISADLPTKIDARWMAKWGLFDHISEKGGAEVPKPGIPIKKFPEQPFIDIVKGVVENTMISEIYMDLRPFCRLLTAHGVHPAWVPITAVAEAINALSDERTLLRTGFINLFKEGFWDYETLDKLLAGFFIASFAVEYFDVEKREWVPGAINVPVRFLPAERRLLELRASMDRALDILRDLVKELNRAFAEHIVLTHDDYIKELKHGIELTNTWFKPLIKELTGKELELKVDMDYYKAYAKVLDVYRDIYTFHRIRYWIGRIITWSLYRLAYAYVTVEDIKKIVSIFKDYGRLTDKEVELIEKIAEIMVGIARREYIPTPSMLATMAEIVPEIRKYMLEVFEKRMVPKEWWSIWRKYIILKPVYDDIKAWFSAIERAYREFAITTKMFENALKKLKLFGWEEVEIVFRRERIEIERALEAYRELIGSPKSLVVMAEYSPRARRLALAQVYKMIDALPTDPNTKEFIKAMWEEYIRVKPVYDEVRRYVTELIMDYAKGVITYEQLEQELKELKEWGLDDYEIQFYLWLAEKRRARYAVSS